MVTITVTVGKDFTVGKLLRKTIFVSVRSTERERIKTDRKGLYQTDTNDIKEKSNSLQLEKGYIRIAVKDLITKHENRCCRIHQNIVFCH